MIKQTPCTNLAKDVLDRVKTDKTFNDFFIVSTKTFIFPLWIFPKILKKKKILAMINANTEIFLPLEKKTEKGSDYWTGTFAIRIVTKISEI